MEELREVIAKVVKEVYGEAPDIILTRPDEKFGDYSTNVAMQLGAKLSKNPREIAEEIKAKLEHNSIAKTEVAGAGFINVSLSDEALLGLTTDVITAPFKDQTIVIETNNPNPFKAMHIGHAFNAILGDCIANLIEQGGAKLYRVSYHGDIGLHVGKSMYSLLKFVSGDASKLGSVEKEERNSFMSRMYAEGSKAYKEDEKAKAEIDKLATMSFTREDALYAEVYETCKDWSFEQINETVKRLGNKPTVRQFLESEADTRGVPIVKAHVPDVFKESGGAIIFEGSKYGSFDNVFVSGRGLGLYGARDIGLIKLKDEQYHPIKSYIVTAEEQKAYFKGVIAAAELCLPELKGQTINISTGTVKLTTGKMSSRTGEVVEIAWLFDQVAEAIKARGGTPNDEIIAGALRYQFLKVRVGSDVVFDINEAVSLQGNSGSYLQYAHARARSILKKDVDFKPGSLTVTDKLQPDERSLLRKIGEFVEIVDTAINELMPHHITTYLYELAQEFNRFYEKNRVIDDARQTLRVDLVSLYADTLKRGLDLLGIHAPEQM